MKDDDFKGLMQSLQEARAYAQGKPVLGIKVHTPSGVDVVAIRRKAGLSQMAFSKQIGVSPATLRNWEQGRRVPDGPARVLLNLLAHDPMLVSRTLGKAA